MARLYANENFPLQVVIALRTLGHDVLTVREAGLDNQSIPDADVVRFATERNRAVITINRRDFIRLHRENPQHGGIIACTEDPDPQGQAQRIHEAICAYESLHNILIRVYRPA